MRVPILSAAKVPTVCESLIGGARSDFVEQHVDLMGDGLDLDVDRIADASDEFRKAHDVAAAGRGSSDPDRLEGEFGARVHALLSELAVEAPALDSPGFWAYLGTRHFWWFVTWRHPGPFASGPYSNYRRYVDGLNPAECVPLRAYIRARLVFDPRSNDPYGLVSAVPRGADFWRSHVLRVRTGTSPAIARAFARRQAEDRMGTDDLRAFARRLNRQWSNLVLHGYDEDDARRLLDELADSDRRS